MITPGDGELREWALNFRMAHPGTGATVDELAKFAAIAIEMNEKRNGRNTDPDDGDDSELE